MNTIQQNIDALDNARANVANHPMCAKLVEEPGRIIVFFPRGFAIGAAQMRYAAEGVSKAQAFRLLLNTMEKYWNIG